MINASSDQDILTIDICVCTFRRPHLADTLSSLAKLKMQSNWQVRIIVADNDTEPSAKDIVQQAIGKSQVPILYIQAPAHNISIARNACLEAATGKMLAFIDDDELASPEWLSGLVSQQYQTKADVILGPVVPRYPNTSPEWLRNEKFHAIKPVWVYGKIVTGYTSNVLFVREAESIRGQRFDPGHGRSGGEDTIFFSAVYAAGGRFDYAKHAVVSEHIPDERMEFMWLVRRFFRSGQTHGTLLMADKTDPKSRWQNIAIAGAKAIFCGFMAAACTALYGRARYWFLRGTLHAGVVARLLGKPELIQYG